MVEIDGVVIRLAREHLPAIGGDAWDDKRANVIVGDGIAYVRDAATDSVDVIVVDSTDPAGPGEALFSDAFYADTARILRPGGLIVNQCGVPFMQADELRDTSAIRARHFKHVGAYVAAVPTYVGGFMALGIAGDAAPTVDVATIEKRATDAGILAHDAILVAFGACGVVRVAALHRRRAALALARREALHERAGHQPPAVDQHEEDQF